MLCNYYKRLLCFDCQHCESDLSLSSVSVASLDPPVAEDMKMLGVSSSDAFDKHVFTVARPSFTSDVELA